MCSSGSRGNHRRNNRLGRGTCSARTRSATSRRTSARRSNGSDSLFRERFLQLANDGGLDGRRRALNKFTESTQLLDYGLAFDAELCGDLMHAWFSSHNSPVRGVTPEQGTPLVRGTHFEPLISGPSAFNLFRDDVGGEPACLEWAAATKRSSKSSPRNRVVHAIRCGVDPRPATGCGCRRIDDHGVSGQDDSQERGSIIARTTTDTGSDGFHSTNLIGRAVISTVKCVRGPNRDPSRVCLATRRGDDERQPQHL